MTKRLRVVLHAEVVLAELWGSPEDWEETTTAIEVARESIAEDWSSLLEEATGGDITKLVQSAEWVDA